jgi:hypothetical protein
VSPDQLLEVAQYVGFEFVEGLKMSVFNELGVPGVHLLVASVKTILPVPLKMTLFELNVVAVGIV